MHPIFAFMLFMPVMAVMVLIILLCIVKRKNRMTQEETSAAILQAATRRKLSTRVAPSCNLTPPRYRLTKPASH